jgi:anti-sigma-K factor RskA
MGLRPTQDDEEQWWRELQLAASASAGGRAANFGLFFSLQPRLQPAVVRRILACSSTER